MEQSLRDEIMDVSCANNPLLDWTLTLERIMNLEKVDIIQFEMPDTVTVCNERFPTFSN